MTCNGIPRGPVLPVSQMTWCGSACGSEGLRYSNQGVAGMNGWLTDESYPNERVFSSSIAMTSFYGTCDPPVDGFVQSYDPEDGEPTNFSLYTFGYGEEYLLEGGMLLSSEISFQSSSSYDLDTLLDHYKLVGPKNLVYYGVTGPAEYVFNFDTSTIGDWDTEPELLWTTDSSYVIKDVGDDVEFTDITLGDRLSEHLLYTLGTADLNASVLAIVEIDDTHLAMARLVENGASYTVYLDVLEYNFSTSSLDTVNSYLAWSDEPRPLEHVFSSNRVVFIPTWGANGTLYMSHPGHTSTKTEEGMLVPYTWDGVDAFTVGTPIESGIRKGHMGSCIGWDGTTDRLVYGIEDDEIATRNSAGVSGPTYVGARDSLLGNTFATGDGYTIAWDSDVSGPKLLRLNVSSWSLVYSFGWSYNCDSVLYSGVFHPLGVSGVRAPRMSGRTSTGGNLITVWKQADETLGYSSGFKAHHAWGKSARTYDYNTGWYINYVRYGTLSPNWGLFETRTIADTLTPLPKFSSSVNFCMYDGSNEAVVHILTSSDELRRFYNVTNFGTTLGPHTQIGSHYVKVAFNLEEFTDILTGLIGFESFNESVEKRSVKYFLQLDSDPLFYVTSAGGLVGYASIEDAKANAELATLYGSRVPAIDVSLVQTLYTYVLLVKEFSTSYPLLPPKSSYCKVEVTGPGLSEPVVLMHFEGEPIERPQRTTAGVLSVESDPLMLTTGTKMVVSGTETRTLFGP